MERYVIVDGSPFKVSTEVNRLLAMGYEPLGGVMPYGSTQVMQAMVKRELVEKTPRGPLVNA